MTSRIRLESCTLELDGRALLAAKPKPRVDVTAARVLVPLPFVASAVRTQLPGFSLAIPDDASSPRVEFAGDFEADDMLPGWLRKLMPDSWSGKFSVEGVLELRTTPSGRLQVVVMDASVAGMHVPKALNIQRWILERARQHIASSSFLRKGSGDALFEIDLPAVAKKAGVELDLPKKSSVSLEGDDVVVTFGEVRQPKTVRAAKPATRILKKAARTTVRKKTTKKR